MNLGQKLNIAEQVAMILADIHSKGLVHGNLKPTNVLFSEERVLVSDYCWP
jgi:tRNA A-37 threonylcarbamoyl transferase component Bud32